MNKQSAREHLEKLLGPKRDTDESAKAKYLVEGDKYCEKSRGCRCHWDSWSARVVITFDGLLIGYWDVEKGSDNLGKWTDREDA